VQQLHGEVHALVFAKTANADARVYSPRSRHIVQDAMVQ